MHIIIEGLDGTGKTTILNALKDHLEEKTIFDVVEFEKIHKRLPQENDVNRGVRLQEADVLLLAEPTHAGIGQVIRSELIAVSEIAYSQRTLAHAYAIDREILLKRLIIPSRKRNQIIIQSRGWISSLVYQKALDKSMKLSELRGLPGNILAEQYLPDAIIYTRVKKPELILERMKGRKYDKHENLSVQEKVFNAYESTWFRNYRESLDVTWMEVDVSGDVESGIKNFLKAYKKILSKNRTS